MLSLARSILVFCCFISVWGVQNPYCSLPCNSGNGQKYLHTVCERNSQKCAPSPSCGPDAKEITMTDELRQYVLDLHNHLRNKVASGNETRNRQPPSSKMMTLKYSKELEYIAQCWTNTCHGKPLIHDFCRGTKTHNHVGQNLGYINSSANAIDIKKSIRDLIMYWYDEVAIFKSEWVPDTKDRGPNVKVGHYTQLIWADTDAIGCAVTYYTTPNTQIHLQEKKQTINLPKLGNVVFHHKPNEKWHHIILACNYSPGGNYLGSPVYDAGKPCSRCPKNKQCGEYSSLCGKGMKIKSVNDKFLPVFKKF